MGKATKYQQFCGFDFLRTGFHNGQLGKRKAFTVSMLPFFVQTLLFIFKCTSILLGNADLHKSTPNEEVWS